MLRKEKGEYGIFNLELKTSDVETDWSPMLQIAGHG